MVGEGKGKGKGGGLPFPQSHLWGSTGAGSGVGEQHWGRTTQSGRQSAPPVKGTADTV